MVELIKKTISCTQKLHRRYIVTTGDTHSPNALARLEHELRAAYPDERYGTHDTVVVTRARRVHQPLWTSPWTCVQCAFEIVSALTRSPGARQRGDGHGHFRYPHVVFTNGPATGFIVAGVAWLLKLLGLTPADRLKVVYVETWAHVTSLSVTGKLMHWTGLPDLFCAQHKKLADRYGKLYISGIVAPAPRPLERVHRSDSNSGDAQSGQEPA